MKHPFTIALLGNPNSGKTTLFNLLTKKGEPVGNRAGVTFSAKTAPLRSIFKNKNAQIMDLPGVYSLFSVGNEEKATFFALKKEHIDVILNIVDATNPEPGLFLTLSLLSMGIPVVLALNMMDEVVKEGIVLDIPALENALGIRIFPISASKNIGVEALLSGCLHAQAIPEPILFSNRTEADRIIHRILEKTISKKGSTAYFSDRLDRIICRPIIGIPLFFTVMSLVFLLTFSSIGGGISSWMEHIFFQISLFLQKMMYQIGVSSWLCRFLTDGVWMGVTAVLAFIPQTAILFFLLSALEDSGYLSRAVLTMDRITRPLGVSGKVILPMLIGFGCTVPAVMATTALSDDEKERTISSLPFIPCNARLPILILIASSFFEGHKAIFAIGLYILCIIVTFISIIISKKGNEDVSPLIMELPKYRPPSLTNLIREVKNKLKDFFVRAGTVVFLSCVVVNLLAMLTPDFHLTENCEESILFYLGNGFAPVFAPLGFGDGRIITALASGFFAKESIVSVIQILIPNGLSSALSEAGAFSLAVFSLLYIPCLATLSVVRRELGIKKAVLILFRTFLFAIMISYISYTAFSFLSK